jgi:hypothetical protein
MSHQPVLLHLMNHGNLSLGVNGVAWQGQVSVSSVLGAVLDEDQAGTLHPTRGEAPGRGWPA